MESSRVSSALNWETNSRSHHAQLFFVPLFVPGHPLLLLDQTLCWTKHCAGHALVGAVPDTHCQAAFNPDSFAWELGISRASAIVERGFHLIMLSGHPFLAVGDAGEEEEGGARCMDGGFWDSLVLKTYD